MRFFILIIRCRFCTRTPAAVFVVITLLLFRGELSRNVSLFEQIDYKLAFDHLFFGVFSVELVLFKSETIQNATVNVENRHENHQK
jgi:hypothetical protein